MKKVMFEILIVFALLMSVIGSGCIDTGHSVDVGFLVLHHEQYDHVESWEIVEEGILSYTVDLHFVDGRVRRLHYVTSIDIID